MLPDTTPVATDPRKEKLTAFQERFVEAYIRHGFNGTQAYLEVGKTDNRKTAAAQASKLLATPKVKDAYLARTREALGPTVKAVRENVEFWAEIRDAKKEKNLVRLQDVLRLVEQGAEKEEFEELETFDLPEHRTTDRIAASKEIAKYANMYEQPLDPDEEERIQIVDDIH
jgi:phage terminase small subunit